MADIFAADISPYLAFLGLMLAFYVGTRSSQAAMIRSLGDRLDHEIRRNGELAAENENLKGRVRAMELALVKAGIDYEPPEGTVTKL